MAGKQIYFCIEEDNTCAVLDKYFAHAQLNNCPQLYILYQLVIFPWADKLLLLFVNSMCLSTICKYKFYGLWFEPNVEKKLNCLPLRREH
jgi:hypothetical protein